MKKRIPALLLAFCLLLTVPALAVEDSTENFTRTKTYAGQFTDLAVDSAFYDNVSALYEYGLSVGKGDGTYGLTDSLTVGQAVIFAGRVRSLYRTGDPETGSDAYGSDGGPVARRYLRYLQAEGALDNALDDNLGDTATRAQMAHILANVLPEEALPSAYGSLVTEAYASRRFITDVTEYTPYYQDILTLYRVGVCVGSDETGSFLPNQAITRGAVAAMLTRMLDPALRAAPQWDMSAAYSAKGTTLADLVTPGTYIAAPETEEEMDSSIRYMLSSGSDQLKLQYSQLSTAKAREIMELALSVVKTYCEQSYNSVTCAYNLTGSLTLTFSAQSAQQNLAEYREATMEAAIAVHDQLWEEGRITADMSEMEKARVYFTWICANCVYDRDAGDESISHIPYGLFQYGTAVCDGYTGAYNLLLKLEGIDCTALANDNHIWTVATLDGTQYHIDTTWGDSGRTANYTFFAMTPSQSWQQHSW
jgi:hypothetical protein